MLMKKVVEVTVNSMSNVNYHVVPMYLMDGLVLEKAVLIVTDVFVNMVS